MSIITFLNNNTKKINYNAIIVMLLNCFFLQKCGIYKFTSSSLPPEVQTFKVENFISKFSDNVHKIAPKLTLKLKNRLIEHEGLIDNEVLKYQEEADLKFVGVIKSCQVETKGDISEAKISLEIEYTDYKGKKNKIPITKYKQLRTGTKELKPEVLNDLLEEILNEIINKSINIW